MQSLGRVIDGKYRLLHVLGRGGMGTVWLAEHLTLHAHVAIKFVHADAAEDWRNHQRFAREARVSAALRGPHVVQVLDHGTFEGLPYIVMEHLVGESLAVRLSREGQLRPELVDRVMSHVARAMTRVHAAGIVHRDLKPGNVFLVDQDDDGVTAKVLDFGLVKSLPGSARANTALTEQGSIVGTIHYLCPEQIEGAPASPSADLWAMAVIAFECLLGSRPFTGTRPAELIRAICSAPVVTPSTLAEVPRGFDDWFARATRRNPAERFQSAKELADALTDVLVWAGDGPLPLTAAGAARRAPPPTSIAAYPSTCEPHLRSDERFPSSIPASLDGRRDLGHVALIVNISRSGALLWTRRGCAVGEDLLVTIHFDDDHTGLVTRARVVRATPRRHVDPEFWPFEVAIRFSSPLVGVEEHLERLRRAAADARRTR
ncbi:MAG TPA: serine/threonine-protein kinase [Polyangiaceae bacterium]|nr:serine/threonine-protein kinase [Polyangiaceae bacterium]